jgi:RNAse (barnase) inhibitor barstar
MGLVEHVSSTEPPWVELLILPENKALETVAEKLDKFFIVMIDGPKCTTKGELFSMFGKEFKFPSYFGNNWDAFEECINDLTWVSAKGYLVIITNAEHLLRNSENDYKVFVAIMQEAGFNWANRKKPGEYRQAVPFHVLLTISNKDKLALREWGLPLMEPIRDGE